jgi:hypothetical protein
MSHVGSKATRQDGLLGPLGYFVHVNGTTPAILLLLVVARVRKLLLEPGLLCVSAT